MKKPIKINTNRDPLSNDEIKRHQNFKNTWQNQYIKPKLFYKNPKFFWGVMLIMTIVIVLIIDSVEQKESQKMRPEQKINVPVKNIDLMPDTIKVKLKQIEEKPTETNKLDSVSEADF